MLRLTFALLLVLFLLPASAFATQATFSASRTLYATSSAPGNAYVAGGNLILTAPITGDLSAVGGSIAVAADVDGDELLIGGSVSVRAPVAGDVRIIAGGATLNAPVGGDLIVAAYSVNILGRVDGSALLGGMEVRMMDGAEGPVRIYANNVALAGDFGGDVTILAGSRVRVAPGTHIRGALVYEAPEPTTLPPSVTVDGGVKYTSASYLPGTSASRALAFMGVAVFLLVRILGALILAGLLAGLFPRPAEEVVDMLLQGRLRRVLLTALLGFAVFVAVPVLILILALTFVGIGIALLLLFAYLLLTLLSLLYAGVALGNVLARRFGGREHVLWRDGVVGMLVLSVATLVPVLGPVLVALLTVFTAGALTLLFFRFAFQREAGPQGDFEEDE